MPYALAGGREGGRCPARKISFGKKIGRKITYPPPADALPVAKKCNGRG